MASLEKAMFFDPDNPTGKQVYVQFNPNSLDYTYAKEPGAEEGGRGGQQQSPLASQTRSRLSVRLFFNTYTSETSYTDVREEILPLRGFLCRTEETETTHGSRVVFAWGTLAFQGWMDSFSVTYQMFAADGTPVRAEVSLSISGEDAELGGNAPARKKVDTTPAGGDEDLTWLLT